MPVETPWQPYTPFTPYAPHDVSPSMPPNSPPFPGYWCNNCMLAQGDGLPMPIYCCNFNEYVFSSYTISGNPFNQDPFSNGETVASSKCRTLRNGVSVDSHLGPFIDPHCLVLAPYATGRAGSPSDPWEETGAPAPPPPPSPLRPPPSPNVPPFPPRHPSKPPSVFPPAGCDGGQIMVKVRTGRTISINVDMGDTIATVKLKVQDNACESISGLLAI